MITDLEMPTLGSLYIPQFRLNALEDSIRRLFDKFSFEETSSDLIAQLLGYSNSSSGTFYTRKKDLEAYGLITSGGRGKYRVTELGKRIVHPISKEEQDKAFKEAILNIPLWSALSEKFPNGLPETDLWVDLAKISRVEPNVAKGMERFVRTAYNEDIAEISSIPLTPLSERKSYSLDNIKNSQSMQQPIIERRTELDEGFGTISIGSYGTVTVKDDDSLAAAEAFLNIIRKRVENAKKESRPNDPFKVHPTISE